MKDHRSTVPSDRNFAFYGSLLKRIHSIFFRHASAYVDYSSPLEERQLQNTGNLPKNMNQSKEVTRKKRGRKAKENERDAVDR